MNMSLYVLMLVLVQYAITMVMVMGVGLVAVNLSESPDAVRQTKSDEAPRGKIAAKIFNEFQMGNGRTDGDSDDSDHH